MGTLFAPLLEAAVAELSPVLLSAGRALLGGAATAATGSVSGDKSKEDSKAAPAFRTLPRTGESCKKCPPEQTGLALRRSHYMNAAPREYQGRITGRPYNVAEGWSEEWHWSKIDFDGFKPAECLLQEAKGNYDQFVDQPWAIRSFKGFDDMTAMIMAQSEVVAENPPARLMWYFEGPKTRQKMLEVLTQYGVPSVVAP
ncbi:restriction endonuclease fold toxin 5 domain-containing protein [Paraburkholderia bryophila]|uniref:restriction endonuclease fold toxin 5 domain-containing protein n=1 Tax=Paraburkholderia bryophila TaxID=420952 RepID=UPI00234B03A5|nr:restriction endonuclease fold toxin 5 domain-containing protein [Paraburkholderia bryophila]WCM21305.1 restriction endonuclease fold toxin 5 domain-containing protein [Paraburkholderia bryophila]